MHLYFAAALGRPSFHQSQDVQAHVVLAAAPQREAEAGWASFQVYAVEPRLVLETGSDVSALHARLISEQKSGKYSLKQKRWD